MKMRILVRLACVGILLLAVLPPCGGQVAAVIIYHEGGDFEVRDGRGNLVESGEIVGRELNRGDMLITYDGAFLELQLVPSRNVIKIAENTEFRLESPEAGRQSGFEMLYGRVRAKVEKLARDERFRIRGNAAVAGVRGTDFGMDVAVPQEGAATEAVTRVYCFEGEVEVQPIAAGAAKAPEAVPAVVIRGEEMVSVSPQTLERPLDVIPIWPEIRSYWQAYPFRGQPARAMLPGPQEPAGGPAAQVQDSLIAGLEQARRRLKITGGLCLTAGIISAAAGLLSFYLDESGSAAPGRLDWDDAELIFSSTGGFLVGGAALSFLASHQVKVRIGRLTAGR
jgi:hypothetical protein